MILKHTSFFILMFLIFASSGFANDLTDNNKNINIPSSNVIITMRKYTEDDLRKIFNEIRSESFGDISDKTRLIFKEFKVFGYSSPFTLNIFININQINKYEWPEDAVRGLFAHELSHQVSYKRRSFCGRMLFIWSYPFSKSRRRKVEEECDKIAIERGYGKELVQERIYQFSIDNKKRIEKEKKVYLSVKALEKLI